MQATTITTCSLGRGEARAGAPKVGIMENGDIIYELVAHLSSLRGSFKTVTVVVTVSSVFGDDPDRDGPGVDTPSPQSGGGGRGLGGAQGADSRGAGQSRWLRDVLQLTSSEFNPLVSQDASPNLFQRSGSSLSGMLRGVADV